MDIFLFFLFEPILDSSTLAIDYYLVVWLADKESLFYILFSRDGRWYFE